MLKVSASDGTPLHVVKRGPQSGPTVLLLNSLGTDHTMWDRQVPALSSHFQVVMYDARGHGRSGAPPGPYSLDLLAADAMAILDSLELERVHLCGSSLGGQTALALAARWPERVDRAVFANTAAKVGSPAGWEARIDAVREMGMPGLAGRVVDRFFSPNFRAGARPDICTEFERTLAGLDPEGYIGACDALRDADLRAEVGMITARTLVIAGTADEATPPTDGLWLQSQITNSDLLILGGAGHLSNVERPDAFNDTVIGHLTRS